MIRSVSRQAHETSSVKLTPHYWKSFNNHYYSFGDRLLMFSSPFLMIW